MVGRYFLATALLVAAGQQPAAVPPVRLLSGSVTMVPNAVGGGEAFFEVTLDADGRVTGATPFRTTPPFTELLAAALRDWRFEIARTPAGIPPVSKVFVGTLFRPPAIYASTVGVESNDAGTASNDIPRPIIRRLPAFHIRAFNPGVVLVEMRVEPDGLVSQAHVMISAPPFDELALDAAREWKFHPAYDHGKAVASYAYVLFGFPLPIVVR